MKANKEFKKLDEQIEILRNKGLTVNDPNYAADVLFRENYFLEISGFFGLTPRQASRNSFE